MESKQDEIRDVIVAALKAKYGDKVECREYFPQLSSTSCIMVKVGDDSEKPAELDYYMVTIDPEWFEMMDTESRLEIWEDAPIL